MQISFYEELITILRKKQLFTKSRYKFKKVNNFFLSQKVDFI